MAASAVLNYKRAQIYDLSLLSGRSAAWLARLVRDQEVEGSNPFAPTNSKFRGSWISGLAVILLLTAGCAVVCSNSKLDRSVSLRERARMAVCNRKGWVIASKDSLGKGERIDALGNFPDRDFGHLL